MIFRGGYLFRKFEGTAEPVLRDIPVPEKVCIPISGSPEGFFTPAVSEGETVRAGDTIIKSTDGTKTSIVSPVNGIVLISDKNGITIKSDGSSSFEPVKGHTREPWHLDHAEVFDLFCATGCPSLFNNRFSSLDKCSSVKNIIINSVHNSPLNRSWAPEITGDSALFSSGLKTLGALFPEAGIAIALNKRNKAYFEAPEIKEHAKTTVISDRYPREHPELLSREILNKRFISPEGVTDESIFVIPHFDVIQIAEVMTRGRPLIDRIMLVAGPGVSDPGWYRIRIGTPFEELNMRLFKWEYLGPWRIIRGNVFTGEGLESLDTSVMFSDHEISVVKEHAARDLFRFMMPGFAADSYPKITVANFINILPKKLETNIHGGVRPCVQCNYCDEVCPVDLYPLLIWKHLEVDEIEESFRFKPYDCIECGLCDYVCPSKIEILTSVKKAKDEYRALRRADDISD